MTRAPDHIVRDLSAKLANDIIATIDRSVSLVDHPGDRFIICLHGAGLALGAAIGWGEKSDLAHRPAEETADFILTHVFRPMVLGMLADKTPEQIVNGIYGVTKRGPHAR